MTGQFTKLDDLRRGLFLSGGKRASKGYELVESITNAHSGKPTSPDDGPWIIEKVRPDEQRLAKWTRILSVEAEEEQAHTRFARLTSHRDILDFANRFGLLGLNEGVNAEGTGRQLGRYNGHFVPTESVQRWEFEVARFAALRALWGHLGTGRKGEAKLGDMVSWAPGQARVAVSYGWILGRSERHRLIATKGRQYSNITSPGMALDEKGRRVALFEDLLVPPDKQETGGTLDSWPFLTVSEPIRDHLFTALNTRCSAVSPQLATDGQISFQPRTLLSTLYLLFMVEVARWDPDRKQCPGCLEYFIAQKRRDKTYCSAECRKLFWDRENRSKAARAKSAAM